jgi:hypothetical protein
MSIFVQIILSLCCYTLAFVGGCVLGFFISAPSRIERIRRMQRDAQEQIDATFVHYTDVLKDLSDKLDKKG